VIPEASAVLVARSAWFVELLSLSPKRQEGLVHVLHGAGIAQNRRVLRGCNSDAGRSG